jgi:hypothetical protein
MSTYIQVKLSPQELQILQYSLEHFKDITEQCIQDYLGYHGHREQIVEMVIQMETIQELATKLHVNK